MINPLRRRPVRITQAVRPGSIVVGRPGRRLMRPVVLHVEQVVSVRQLNPGRPGTRVVLENGRQHWLRVTATELDDALDRADIKLKATSPAPRPGRAS